MDEKNNKVLDAFDLYGDFSLNQYFANKYNKVPSKMGVYLDVTEEKKTFDRTLELLDVATYQLSVFRKKWTISKNKNADPNEDYVYFKILESSKTTLCVEIELNDNELSLEFFYDQNEEGLEAWIKAQVDVIRNEFATSKAPVFRVLSRTKNGFETQKVKIDLFEVDLEKNYNEDFKKVDAEIRESIEGKGSGLMLLHGKPGTGKTSYIKSLMSKYVESKFLFIPNDFVNELLKPAFITFMIRQRNAVLIIEDAEKIIMSRDNAGENSVVSTILQLTDGLFSDYLNIKVICTFNTDISKVDKALFRKGRMIAFYEFKELSVEKTAALLDDKNTKIDKGLTLAEIYNYNKSDYSEATTKKRIGFN